MADPLGFSDSDGDTGGDTGSTPRWVKVCGIILIALVLLFVVLHLSGHGLGGHMPAIEHGVQQR